MHGPEQVPKLLRNKGDNMRKQLILLTAEINPTQGKAYKIHEICNTMDEALKMKSEIEDRFYVQEIRITAFYIK
jgi:hypothetical protein